MLLNKLVPGVYKIKVFENTSSYYLELIYNKFILPNKIYGKEQYAIATRIWNDYALNKRSTGVLLLGSKGAGKTLVSSIISNYAIDFGTPVILLTEINPTIELIAYISSLSNCVILMDEFAKNVKDDVQKKMLTMLSDLNKTRKLFIITENTDYSLNEFILDRPGRIRYRIDYTKLPIDAFTEYIEENKLTGEFKEDLVKLYKDSVEFSFDHMEAIVSEHLNYPNDTLTSILNVLNVKSLRKKYIYHVTKVIKHVTKEDNTTEDIEVMCTPEATTYADEIDNNVNRNVYLFIKLPNDSRVVEISYNRKLLKEIDKNRYIAKQGAYSIYVTKMLEGDNVI